MNLAALTFDPVTHEYAAGGAALVSVTQAIREAGLMGEGAWFTEEARQRGTYVHQACEWLDRGELDEDALDPALRPFVDAYRWFLHDAQPAWTLIEAPRHCMVHRYAGTVDRVGAIKGQKHPVVLDIKSGGLAPWHSIQLTAYRHLLAEDAGPLVTRCGLYLRDDGTYRLESLPLADRADWETFLAALHVAQWKRSHL